MIHWSLLIPVFLIGLIAGWYIRYKAQAERELYRTFSRDNLKRELEKHRN